MCGLAGVLNLRDRRPVEEKVLRAMCLALGHRGPDGEGVYLDGNLGLAHRRLAVIDPTPAGNQPMVSDDGRLAVCYNGTIYNYPELRAELEKSGHAFRSNCDTEVLLHGWEAWGQDIVHRLNGHFAFALWDRSERRLFLIRDRFGTKPLYYANLGGLWLFASEIKGILAHPAYSLDINHDALYEYFTFQNLFRFHTLFKDVHLLPPANVFVIDAVGGSLQRGAYWDYDFSHPETGMTECEAKQGVQTRLETAVQRQLFSDVPLGAYLSGGMDSGSIVSLASREIQGLYTFTCGFHLNDVEGAESSFDERAAAEAVACLFRTQHYEQVIGHGDVFWILRDLIWHLEDLRLGMCYANYYIARLASKFVKVCLSGAGGDELFGGYPWRYYRVSRSVGREEFIDNYYDYWQRIVPDEERPTLFTGEVKGRLTHTDMRNVLGRVFTFNPGLSYDTPEDHIANSLYFEAKTFLHGLLILGDRLAMAHGLEERFPFLDNDLTDFAQKIPVRHKLRNLSEWKRQDENVPAKVKNYYAEHDDGKNVLRLATEALVPAAVRARKKQGFSSPDESWYRGPSLDLVRKVLLHKKALCHQFVEPAFIRRTLEDHCQKRVNLRLRIWSLLSFETWLRIFAEGAYKSLPEEHQAPYLRLASASGMETGPAAGAV